jgi:hypothetical protein
MSVIGEAACRPVGWTRCGDGFAPDPSGWGCAAVLPAAPCAGSALEVLGQTACQPLGDCGAPFPPAAATVFVDDSYTGAQLDAAHFATVQAALAAAASGATVAVEAGTYSGALVFSRPVTLVGRCAAQVRLVGTGAGPGLDASGVAGVVVDGFSVTGFDLGAYVDQAGSLDLRHSRLEGNLRTGVQAVGAGTVLRVAGSVVRGTLPDATGSFGIGIAAGQGARVDLSSSAVVENSDMGLFLTGAGTTGLFTQVLVRGTRARANGRYGWGLAAQSGATLEVAGGAFLGNRSAGVVLTQGSAGALTQVLVANTLLGLDNVGQPQAVNVAVMPGATLTMNQSGLTGASSSLFLRSLVGAAAQATVSDVVMRGASGGPRSDAASAEAGSRLTLARIAVTDTQGVGLRIYDGATLALQDVLVQGTRPSAEVPSGYGLYVSASAVNATRLTLRENAGAGLALAAGATGTFDRCQFVGTRRGPVGAGANYGVGVSVDGAAHAEVRDSLIAENAGSGLLALEANSTALVRGTLVRGNLFDDVGDGQGVVAEQGAAVQLEQVGVVGNRTAGIQVSDAASLVRATGIVVRDTLPGLAGDRGRGANVQNGARLELTGAAFAGNRQVGLFAYGPETRAVVTGSLIDATAADPDGRFGNAVEAVVRARVDLSGTLLRHSAGIGLMVGGAAATVSGGAFEANAVALHAQDGSTLLEVSVVAEPVGDVDVLVTGATGFVGNGVRLGNGTLPLPER